LGFHPSEIEIETASAGSYPVDISLVPIARSLEPVRILARREPSDARLAGFNQRLARHVGYFITRDQIERTANPRLIDALRRLPGVRVVTLRGAQGRSVTLGGASCPPLVYIDGFPATAGAFDLDMIELGSLEGVEVYSSASAIPPELIGPHGLDRCGVIALWSSPSRPRKIADVDPVDVAALVEAHAVFTAEQVDTAAQYEPGTADPVYPATQLLNHARGRVVIEFVVDTVGGVEPGSITVVTASATVFGDAAKTAVVRGRFSPAVLNGRHVRQVVRMGLDFDPGALSPAPTDSGQPVPPAPRLRSPQES
jgi:TonB family protein